MRLGRPTPRWRARRRSGGPRRPDALAARGLHHPGHLGQASPQPYDAVAAGDWAQWGPERAKRPKPARPVVVPIKITGDGRVRTLEIDLSAQPDYRGAMTQIKLLLPPGPGAARIHAVELNQSEARQPKSGLALCEANL